jgi:prepilin-type N-terminal cleavage/methylation domain-containing protein/prepilin-type processing-associated H-X9-DG protein
MARSSPHRTGFTLIEILVVIFILAILISLLLAGVQKARTVADRVYCANHMKQMGIALHHYHVVKGSFPPGTTGQQPSSPAWDPAWTCYSWFSFILPYIEQETVQKRAEAAYPVQPWPYTEPHPCDEVLQIYTCPGDRRVLQAQYVGSGITVALTSYQGVNGTDLRAKDGIFYQRSATRFSDLQGGAGYTLMVGERPPSADMWFGWWYSGAGQWDFTQGDPNSGSCDVILGVNEINVQTTGDAAVDACPKGPYSYSPGKLDNQADQFHFWSLHPAGSNFLFADGGVRFIKYSSASILPTLAKRDGDKTTITLGD